MKNKLIQLFIERHVNPKFNNEFLWNEYWAILETPCYPCTFYFGPVCDVGNEWVGRTNATCNFHRTIDECLEAAIQAGFNDFTKITEHPMNSTCTGVNHA